MCLLITGPSNSIRNALLSTPGLLDDIYGSNRDGVGAMYTTSKRVLKLPKLLPKTLAECMAFIAQLPNDERQLALHFRMKTHGNLDLENCHPYPVIEGQSALMHNGILQQGNKKDITKSDTWHYIADVVRPMLAEAPKMFMNKAWMSLIEDDIGNNRFAIMDNEGNLAVANKHQGITHQDMWFSNTYAWSPDILIPTYKKWDSNAWKSHWSTRGIVDGMDDDDALYNYGSIATRSRYAGTAKVAAEALGKSDTEGKDGIPDPAVLDDEQQSSFLSFTEDDVWAALSGQDPSALADYLNERPYFTLHTLFKECAFEWDELLDWAELDKSDRAIVEALEDEKRSDIAEVCKNLDSALLVANAMCYLGNWVGKSIDQKESSDAVEDMLTHLGNKIDAQAEAAKVPALLKAPNAVQPWVQAAAEVTEIVNAAREKPMAFVDISGSSAVH